MPQLYKSRPTDGASAKYNIDTPTACRPRNFSLCLQVCIAKLHAESLGDVFLPRGEDILRALDILQQGLLEVACPGLLDGIIIYIYIYGWKQIAYIYIY